MKLMFTSFDVPYLNLNLYSHYSQSNQSIFHQMPPVRMTVKNKRFEPDYTALLLCDKIILDETSFDLLKSRPHPAYKLVSETMNALYWEGFIELVDFNDILQRRRDQLKEMIINDLKYEWYYEIIDSISIWENMQRKDINLLADELFCSLDRKSYIDRNIKNIYGFIDRMTRFHSPNLEEKFLYSLIKRRFRKQGEISILEIIKELYLSYVNANIIISSEIGVGFYDWADFSPFYNRKFSSVGFERLNQEHIEASRALFEISFPEFAVKDTKTLLRILEDKRIIDLRKIIQYAVDGHITFDSQFARQVLMEVLKVERRTTKYRNIISYLTMPINFVPGLGPLVSTFTPKVAEEIAGKLVESKVRENYRWFYMLSDIVNHDK